jgi:tape measure domain-containing protein
MATDVEKLVVQLSADIRQYERALAKAQGVTHQRARAVESRFQQMNKHIGSQMTALGGIAARAFALIGGAQGFKTLSDAATRVDNSLKVAGLSGAELERVYQQLFEIATKNAAPLEDLVTLYGRASQVQKELGATTEELTTFTDNVAMALRINGRSAAETQGALLQLGQALGSARVMAEEFNSINEGARPILQAVAAGIEEAGGSVAKLKQLVIDGKISNQAFFRGFEAGAVILEQKTAGAVLTIDQRLQNLKNSLVDAARRFNESSQAADTFGSAIDKVAEFVNGLNFDTLISQIAALDNAFRSSMATINSWGAAIGQASGLDNISKWVTGGAATKDFLGGAVTVTSTSAIRDKINQAFEGEIQKAGAATEEALRQSVLNRGVVQTTEKTGRLPAAPVVNPVSLAQFPAPASTSTTTSGGSRGGASKVNDYDQEVKAINERTAALQAETAAQAQVNPLVEDYGFAMAKAKAQQDLLTAAQNAGLKITPELTASIDKLATGYASASVEAQKLQKSQEAVKAAAEDFKQTSKDVTSGFISDLRQGKSAAEALAGALNRVLDKLIDVGLNAAFGLSGTSAGGGLLGGLFSLFGFAGGGYTGSGGKYQPAGIVHKGEYVFDAQATKRLGPKNLARLAGYADGGLVGSAPHLPSMTSPSRRAASAVHVTVGVSADGNGNLMPFVQSVSRREVHAAAPKIVSASQQRVMPTIANYQQTRAGGDYRG